MEMKKFNVRTKFIADDGAPILSNDNLHQRMTVLASGGFRDLVDVSIFYFPHHYASIVVLYHRISLVVEFIRASTDLPYQHIYKENRSLKERVK